MDFEDSGFPFLPKKDDECSPDHYNYYTSDCVFDFQKDEPVVKIMNETFYRKDMFKLHQRWNSTESQYELRKHVENKEFYLLSNPGVPVITIANRAIPTVTN